MSGSDSEVLVHTKDRANFLLCGRMQTISPKRSETRQKSRPGADPDFDLTSFPPPVTDYRGHRPTTQLQSRAPPQDDGSSLREYRRVREIEATVDRIDGYMQTYGDNSHRRGALIHRDWEERYMRPFTANMKRKLNGDDYAEFRQTRTRAETEFQSRTEAALSEGGAVLPCVRIPTTGTDDRVHRWQSLSSSERRLTRIVNESRGVVEQETEIKERMTVDPQAWRLLPDTRLSGGQSGVPVRKGRRPFSAILDSRVGRELDQF
jgi:hypothetical protein